MSKEESGPTVINLNKENSINIIIQYIQLIQDKSGAFDLKEADLLKRSIDVLINKEYKDPEITESLAINLLIQGIYKGQNHGKIFTLNDASLLHKVIHYITTTTTTTTTFPHPIQQTIQQTIQTNDEQKDEDSDDDISSLSAPVPLRPREI